MPETNDTFFNRTNYQKKANCRGTVIDSSKHFCYIVRTVAWNSWNWPTYCYCCCSMNNCFDIEYIIYPLYSRITICVGVFGMVSQKWHFVFLCLPNSQCSSQLTKQDNATQPTNIELIYTNTLEQIWSNNRVSKVRS